jgi:hypothetical protein
MEYGLEKARGQCVRSKRAVREWTARLSHADQAWRTRALSGDAVASLFLEAVYEPRRRWGSKPGGFCGGASWAEGRKGLLPLSSAPSER